jgi:cell wall-associated NlpC family hydrolase
LNQTAPGDVKAQLPGVRWGNAFAAAATAVSQRVGLQTFLGVLLAICDQESSFSNCIEGRHGKDWYPPPEVGASIPPTPGTPGVSAQTLDGWQKLWANEAKTIGVEKGVGPMQLTTPDYKYKADDLGGKRDEYSGGRWIPEYNIMAGAYALASKLEGIDSSVDANIWIGVQAYNGSGDAAVHYRNTVKAKYDSRWKDVTNSVTITGKPGSATGGPTTAPVEGEPDLIQKFVAVALEQLGKPYEWGAEGPNTFDCSGLVDYAARQAGLTKVFRNAARPITTTLWVNPTFSAVAKDGLLHGDLVFFEPDLGHMGIYLSRGLFLQAPHTGDVVKISSLNSGWYRDQYRGARRIIPWTPIKPGEANNTVNTGGSKIAIYHDGAWEWRDGSAGTGPTGGNWLGNADALWLQKNPDEDPKEGSTVAIPKVDR